MKTTEIGNDCTFKRVAGYQDIGEADLSASAVDTLGFDGCCFLISVGAIAETAAPAFKVQHSDDDGSSDAYGDIAGAAVTLSETNDDTVAYIEIVGQRKRYLKLVAAQAAASAIVESAIALLYGGSSRPVAQSAADVSGSARAIVQRMLA